MFEQFLDAPQSLDQFNQTQRLMAVLQQVQHYTHGRRLGNKLPKKAEQIIGGYNKFMNLLDRFVV